MLFEQQRFDPKPARRVSDQMLVAFHNACDEGNYLVAYRILQMLVETIKRPALAVRGDRRQHEDEQLVAARERLWALSYLDPAAEETY